MSLTAPFGKEFLVNGPKVGGLTGNKLAMEVGGLWYLPGFAKVKNIQFGVWDLPIPEGGQRSTIGGGFGWSISKGSKHPKEAWQFVKWMAGYEGQIRLFPGIGAIPSNLKAQKHVYEKVDENSRAFFAMTDYVRQFPNFPGSFKLLQALPGKIYDAFSGKLTPDQALKQAQPDAQRLWTTVAKRRR
jgi:ABC-type glycerol-3-phosphate transport system substrate-binding protein